MNKREFLHSVAWSGLAAVGAGRALAALPGSAGAAPLAEGDFWAQIRAAYAPDPDRINLENGYYAILPQEVLAASARHEAEVNRLGSFSLRTRQADDKLAIRRLLAGFAGCDADEVIVTRNTTESLDTVISGIDWREGDEAVMAAQDYPSMLEMFEQQARRHRIVKRVVSLPNHPRDDAEDRRAL